MPKIIVTMEKTIRQKREFEINDLEFEELKCDTVLPNYIFDEMQRRLEEATEFNADIDYDFAVRDEKDRVILDWN